jgi:hypothetical protein
MTINDNINRLSIRYKQGISTEHTYQGDLQNLLDALLPGYHTIAVKAIDHEGLEAIEAIEVIKLKINDEITIS